MDLITGRPDHIEDYLIQLNTGGWFGWTDSKNKIYANLIVHPKIWDSSYTGDIHEEGMIDNPYSKLTEQECVDGLTQMQTAYDSQAYARNRKAEYPAIVDQLDDIFHNGIDGWKATIQVTKDKYPKE